MKQLLTYLARIRDERGQSLVEGVLFLPIIIILVVGVIEVSNLLLTQNRVASASEAAASFGAANFHEGDWVNTADWSQAMASAATANVTQTLDLSPERWDIYTVKATMASDGTFSEWVPVHAYGDGAVVSDADWTGTYEQQIQQDMQSALNSEAGSLSNDGLQVVSTIAYHNRNSLLGLDSFNVGEFTRVRGFAIRRVDDPQSVAACALLPIAVNLDQFSLYPTNWDQSEGQYLRDGNGNPIYGDDPVHETQIFDIDTFEYPGSLTPYVNNATAPDLAVTTWVNNVPGVPLRAAKTGHLYRARDTNGGSGYPGNFGWLTWDGDTNKPALSASLNFATLGNFSTLYPNSDADQNTIHNWNKKNGTGEASGDGDGVLEAGEWLEGSTGNMHSASADVRPYVDTNTTIILPIFSQFEGNGSNSSFKITRFAKVNIVGYDFTGNDKSIVFEFIEWANSCE